MAAAESLQLVFRSQEEIVDYTFLNSNNNSNNDSSGHLVCPMFWYMIYVYNLIYVW